MSIQALQSLLSSDMTADEYLNRMLEMSHAEDILIQINDLSALLIKGKVYEEKAGRIVQLLALNEKRIEFGGHAYKVLSAKPSEKTYMAYDFEVVRDEGDGDPLFMELEYATVRKMVERKVAAFDPREDNHLLEKLNDMHEDAFTINGKQYYIAGEQWTQSKPGFRDLILIPVGRTDNSQVIKTVSEKLIQSLIKYKRKTFRISEDGDELAP